MAYMPFATQEEFESIYGIEAIQKLRAAKQAFDPDNTFSNAHTQKYFDKEIK
jgi:FAD/FMN-containing dehydrogenase